MKETEKWIKRISPVILLISIIILYNLIISHEIVTLFFSTLSPFVFSVLGAWILNPIVVKLTNRFKIKRWLASIIVIAMVIFIVVLIILIIVPEMVAQIGALIDLLPDTGQNIQESLTNFTENFDNPDIQKYIEGIGTDLVDIVKRFIDGGASLIASTISVFGDIVSGIFIFVMIFIASIYILIDFDKLTVGTRKLVPKRYTEDFNFLSTEVNRVVIGYIRGLIIETILVTLISYVILVILRIDGALVFAAIIGITNIIPYLGPYIGAVPLGIYALTDSVKLFVIVVIAVIVIQQIDGILIKPKVFGKTTDVHPALSIISVILFGKMFGFFGVVFAIPVTALIIVLIKFIYGKLLIKYPEKLR